MNTDREAGSKLREWISREKKSKECVEIRCRASEFRAVLDSCENHACTDRKTILRNEEIAPSADSR